MMQQQTAASEFVLVIHGGAGTILKTEMTAEKEAAYHDALQQALQAGYGVLKKLGTAVDAVAAAVQVLEDCPLFNAGRGSVFTNEGKNEMDAAIMNGATLEAGAVAAVTQIKNPILAAKAVMEKSEHVLMIGSGAEKFAAQNGLALADENYFFTDERWNALQALKTTNPGSMALDHGNKAVQVKQKSNNDNKYGTVGAVALDSFGNLAAATSTGGMTNKQFGRVGDTPLIGAGTYANEQCAVSCTGWGEFFIRLVAAKTVADIMEYRNDTLQNATEEVIQKKLPALGGDGGLIAVDAKGNIALPFNTEGMYRGYIKSNGNAVINIYKD